jgi:hypothetical protein
MYKAQGKEWNRAHTALDFSERVASFQFQQALPSKY